MKRETVFLNGNGFLVTNTRFEVPGQTYVMGGVTSVKVTKTVPSKFGSILSIILGFSVIMSGILFTFSSVEIGLSCLCLGLILLLLGGLSLWSKKTVYHLVLTTAAGEQKATSSTNAKFMESLRTALTNAIIYRG